MPIETVNSFGDWTGYIGGGKNIGYSFGASGVWGGQWKVDAEAQVRKLGFSLELSFTGDIYDGSIRPAGFQFAVGRLFIDRPSTNNLPATTAFAGVGLSNDGLIATENTKVAFGPLSNNNPGSSGPYTGGVQSYTATAYWRSGNDEPNLNDPKDPASLDMPYLFGTTPTDVFYTGPLGSSTVLNPNYNWAHQAPDTFAPLGGPGGQWNQPAGQPTSVTGSAYGDNWDTSYLFNNNSSSFDTSFYSDSNNYYTTGYDYGSTYTGSSDSYFDTSFYSDSSNYYTTGYDYGSTYTGSSDSYFDTSFYSDTSNYYSTGYDYGSTYTGSSDSYFDTSFYSDTSNYYSTSYDYGSTYSSNSWTSAYDDNWDTSYLYPILLDLDGNGVKVTELSQSTTYLDSGDDGLAHRTAWAGAGDGVLFYDVGGDNKITEAREYVFTEWDPTATDDMAALRAAFDANGDGKLTAADAAFASFKVMVTNADGTQTAQTLTALGITEIRLTQDATNIVLPDGSVITGQSTFLRSNGTTGTVANTTLATESMGYKITSNQTIAAGTVTIDIKAFDATGALDHAEKSVTNATGSTRTVSYDNDGNSVWDSLQTTVKTTNAASEQVTTITNQSGGVDIAAVVMNSMLWPCTYQTKV